MFILGALTGIILTVYLHHARWVQRMLWWVFTTDVRSQR